MQATPRALARTLVKGALTAVRQDESIADAARRLARDNVGALPVYDGKNHLCGMITDRDIVVNVVAEGRDPMKTRVGDLRMERPVTVDADAPVEQAIELMEEHRIRRLPVVDGSECIGIISQADIARTMPPEKVGELVAHISAD